MTANSHCKRSQRLHQHSHSPVLVASTDACAHAVGGQVGIPWVFSRNINVEGRIVLGNRAPDGQDGLQLAGAEGRGVVVLVKGGGDELCSAAAVPGAVAGDAAVKVKQDLAGGTCGWKEEEQRFERGEQADRGSSMKLVSAECRRWFEQKAEQENKRHTGASSSSCCCSSINTHEHTFPALSHPLLCSPTWAGMQAEGLCQCDGGVSHVGHPA